jgi:hypothetical protein
MSIEETTALVIECDSPACPGHPDLDSADRTGWLFVTHEIYGEPTRQHVFGDAPCLSVASSAEYAEGLGLTPGAEDALASGPRGR